jgi:hypothetical protein
MITTRKTAALLTALALAGSGLLLNALVPSPVQARVGRPLTPRADSKFQKELAAGCRCAMASSAVMSWQTACIPERMD